MSDYSKKYSDSSKKRKFEEDNDENEYSINTKAKHEHMIKSKEEIYELISPFKTLFIEHSYLLFFCDFLFETNQYIYISNKNMIYFIVIFDFIVEKVMESKKRNQRFDNRIIQELKELCLQDDDFKNCAFDNIQFYSIPFVLFFSFYFFVHQIPYQLPNIEEYQQEYENICKHISTILFYEGRGKNCIGYGLIFEIAVRTIEGYSGLYKSGGGNTQKYLLRETMIRNIFQIKKIVYRANGFKSKKKNSSMYHISIPKKKKKLESKTSKPISIQNNISNLNDNQHLNFDLFLFTPAYISFAYLYVDSYHYQPGINEIKV
jgi:hypothetical protein